MMDTTSGWPVRWLSAIGGLLGHIAAIALGFVMIIVGLGLGVTMIMLPVGVVVGLLGVAMVVAGFFAHPSTEGRR